MFSDANLSAIPLSQQTSSPSRIAHRSIRLSSKLQSRLLRRRQIRVKRTADSSSPTSRIASHQRFIHRSIKLQLLRTVPRWSRSASITASCGKETSLLKSKKVFTFQALVSATNDFNPTHKLGKGGFGPVLKGRLPDGRDVAVKKISQASKQGNNEFVKEAKLLSKVQHRNVVNLWGYCTHGEDKLLVYEYVANESLDKVLFSI
ncbi:putative receptor-like protein kinase [Raphanus sativus]|nr:putative receptor-like protein kinase [Raphanus sativus]